MSHPVKRPPNAFMIFAKRRRSALAKVFARSADSSCSNEKLILAMKQFTKMTYAHPAEIKSSNERVQKLMRSKKKPAAAIDGDAWLRNLSLGPDGDWSKVYSIPNNTISKFISREWSWLNLVEPEEANAYFEEQETEKEAHEARNPGYKFAPRQKQRQIKKTGKSNAKKTKAIAAIMLSAAAKNAQNVLPALIPPPPQSCPQSLRPANAEVAGPPQPKAAVASSHLRRPPLNSQTASFSVSQQAAAQVAVATATLRRPSISAANSDRLNVTISLGLQNLVALDNHSSGSSMFEDMLEHGSLLDDDDSDTVTQDEGLGDSLSSLGFRELKLAIGVGRLDDDELQEDDTVPSSLVPLPGISGRGGYDEGAVLSEVCTATHTSSHRVPVSRAQMVDFSNVNVLSGAFGAINAEDLLHEVADESLMLSPECANLYSFSAADSAHQRGSAC